MPIFINKDTLAITISFDQDKPTGWTISDPDSVKLKLI